MDPRGIIAFSAMVLIVVSAAGFILWSLTPARFTEKLKQTVTPTWSRRIFGSMLGFIGAMVVKLIEMQVMESRAEPSIATKVVLVFFLFAAFGLCYWGGRSLAKALKL